MGSSLDTVAWASVPLALALATLHAVFYRRHTLWLTAICFFAGLLFCVHAVVAVNQEKTLRIGRAISTAKDLNPVELQAVVANDNHSPRLHFALYALCASLVPLFVGEYRRSRHEKRQRLPQPEASPAQDEP